MNTLGSKLGRMFRRTPLLVNALGVSPDFPFAASPQVDFTPIAYYFGAITGSAGTPQVIASPTTARWYDGKTRVRLELLLNTVTVGGSAGVYIAIYKDAAILAQTFCSHTSSEGIVNLYMPAYDTPSLGFHTFSVKAWKTSGSTQTVDYGELRVYIG